MGPVSDGEPVPFSLSYVVCILSDPITFRMLSVFPHFRQSEAGRSLLE